MRGLPGPGEPPAFAAAVAAVRAVPVRAEVHLEDSPAPSRLAPHALAVGGEVSVGEDDVASGRFVLLHDPDGQEGWSGPWRVVVLARAQVEADLAGDPVLLPVAWTWWEDALVAHDLPPTSLGGTVTRVASQGFGDLAVHPGTVEVQLRSSFSPAAGRAGDAFAAWVDLLCTTAGLPPLPPGVVALRPPDHPRSPSA